MATRTEKSFDCIAFKRKVQAEIYEQIKDLTPAEQVRYFNESARTGPFAKFWKGADADVPQPRPDDRSAR